MKTHRILGASRDAFRDLSLPVFFFGFTLMVGMTVVFALLSPDRFPVHIGSNVLRVGNLTEEEESLTAKQADLFAERDRLLAASPTPVLHTVITNREKSTVAALASGMAAINTVQMSFEKGVIDIASLTSLNSTITVSGTVHDAAGQSIQLLARMTDALRAQHAFAHVTEPEYQSIPGENGSSISPFSITLTLTHS